MGATLGAEGGQPKLHKGCRGSIHSKKSAKAFQAAQTSQGTLRTPCWLLFFSLAKPVIFMTPQLLFPAGSCPPLPAENFCSLTRVFLLPSSSGHGAEETGPFLSARSTEISKHFLSQTELQRRKLGKAWELYFSLTRKGCSGNILNLPLHFNLFPLVNLSPQNAVTSPKVLPSIKKNLETFFPMHFFSSQEMFWSCFPQTGLVLIDFLIFFFPGRMGKKYKSHHLV